MTVTDASVWVSYLLPQDINHNSSRNWINHYLASNKNLVAPNLLLAEVAGAVRRRSGQVALAQQVVDRLNRLRGLQLVPLTQPLSVNAAKLATDLQLRGADAVYVAVAAYLNLPLLSWDQEHINRAGQAIQVYTPLTAP